jgi:hypothetical protein
MRQSVFSLPPVVRQSVLWCRPCLGSIDRFAVGLPAPLPLGVAAWLRENCQVLAVQSLSSSCVAVQVWVPGSLSHVFHTLPQPRGGSRHPSNYLPW